LPRLKAEPSTARIPLLAVLPEKAGALAARTLRLGADETIARPVDPVELKVRVNGLLQREALWREKERLSREWDDLFLHELLEPLAGIQAMSEVLLRRSSGSDFAEMADGLDHIVSRATGILDSLAAQFDPVRLSPRRLRLDRLPSDVSLGLQGVVNGHRPLVQQKRLRLSSEIESGLTAEIDPVKFGTAVSHLLGNAIRYTPEGGEIVFSGCAHDGSIQVAVTDSGPGISLDLQRKLFMPWRHEGPVCGLRLIGLGLAVVRMVAEAHGGGVAVDSELGRGSTFRLWVPPRPGPKEALLRAA
jgi:signal transduction histidine kinase